MERLDGNRVQAPAEVCQTSPATNAVPLELPRSDQRLRGEDVKTMEEFAEFWEQRADLLFGQRKFTPVSDAVAKEALRRTLNLGTRHQLKDLNESNYARNESRLRVGHGIRDIDGVYLGRPAFLVAAGPSLDRNVAELARVAGRWPIFAVDATLPILAARDIEPDYALVIDPKTIQAKFFRGVKPSTRTKLIAVSCTHPEVLDAWPGEILFFNTWGAQEDHDIQLKHGQDFGSIGVGGNVSTAMLWLASVFCCASPLVLVGHDFSYGSRYYARGGVDENAPKSKTPRYTWDINGETVRTDLSLWSYRIWTEELVGGDLKNLGFRVINATEGGILGTTEEFQVNSGAFEYAKLSAVIDQLEAASVGSGVVAPALVSEIGDVLPRQALMRDEPWA